MDLTTVSSLGIYPMSQYTYLFIMAINPLIFKLFKPKHYVLFFIGFLGSFVNSRAIMPFMLIALLDLDFSKLSPKDKKAMVIMAFFEVFLIIVFGRKVIL